MGYKAQEKIEPLDYTFVPFADISGKTPEFSPEQIRDYWAGYGHLMRQNRDKIAAFQRRLDGLAEDESRTDVDAEFEAWQKDNADATLDERRRLLAELCSQQPSYDELCLLPGRVFDDFELAMQDALSPKASTRGTN